jgi:hypothetical protein
VKFIERLCMYSGDSKVIADAQKHVLEAHARTGAWDLHLPAKKR